MFLLYILYNIFLYIYTFRLVILGQMVESYLPDANNLSDEEIRRLLKERLKG